MHKNYNCSKIETFKDLLSEIAYSWEYPNYDFHEVDPGVYNLNRLTIGPHFVNYKMEHSELDPKVYSKFLKFIELLEKE